MIASYIVFEVVKGNETLEAHKLPDTYATMLDMLTHVGTDEYLDFYFESTFDTGILIMDASGLRFRSFNSDTSTVIPLQDMTLILQGNLCAPCEPTYITLVTGSDALATA